MKTISDLEAAMRETGKRGMTLYFGPSVSKNHVNQFFANTGVGTPQVYADTLEEALTDLFSAPAPIDEIDDEDLL